MGLDLRGNATLFLTFPDVLPPGTVYWKYQANHDPQWYSITPDEINGTHMTITLTDGGIGDDDGFANREIYDPGGPGLIPQTSDDDCPSIVQDVYGWVYHPEVTHEVYHEAVTHDVYHPAVTHDVYHEPVTHTETYYTIGEGGKIHCDAYTACEDAKGKNDRGKSCKKHTDIITDQEAYTETVVDAEAYIEVVVDTEAYSTWEVVGTDTIPGNCENNDE